ncbi:MAG TPA: response regulator [Paludibacter sp.]
MKNLKILIAEDDEISEMLLSNAVQRFGKEIIKVKTGIDAVEVCCNNADIDVILMDIKMPEMDGYEAIRQIRLFDPNVIIIVQTAFGLTGDREKAFSTGCDEYITKPISQSLLISILEKHFKNNADHKIQF